MKDKKIKIKQELLPDVHYVTVTRKGDIENVEFILSRSIAEAQRLKDKFNKEKDTKAEIIKTNNKGEITGRNIEYKL